MKSRVKRVKKMTALWGVLSLESLLQVYFIGKFGEWARDYVGTTVVAKEIFVEDYIGTVAIFEALCRSKAFPSIVVVIMPVV